MKRLDSRILQLRHLETLDLSVNRLLTLPENPGRWNRLSELRLAQNQLMVLPPVIWQSCLQETLLLLDVSGNTIEELPLQLCHLKNLIQLHVKNNKLRSLPPTIGETGFKSAL